MPAQRSSQSLLLELQDNISADLFASAAPLRLAADEALFLAGDTGDGCYLVEDGLLKVVVASHSGGERILAFLWRGAIVGEMSVIDGRPRSASVVVVRQAALKFLSRTSFAEFTNKYPDVYKYLMKLLASRLREANAVIAAGTFLSLKANSARSAACCARARAKPSTSAGRSLWQSRRSNGPQPWPDQSVLFRRPTMRIASHGNTP
jgi:CRP/FNR family cyclic AMP-dependent transcriptional regulator